LRYRFYSRVTSSVTSFARRLGVAESTGRANSSGLCQGRTMLKDSTATQVNLKDLDAHESFGVIRTTEATSPQTRAREGKVVFRTI